MQAESEHKRLFFALWPDWHVAGRLHRVAQAANAGCGGRVMQQDTLHLTLAFLGSVDAARLPQLDALASAIAMPAFHLSLDRLEYWRHNRILWAGCGEHPSELGPFARDLQAKLRTVGFHLDAHPFTPHVSLIRNALCQNALPAFSRIAWPVTEFVLAESVPSERGATYRILARWPAHQG